MAKGYLAKGEPEPAPEHFGRTWGVIGRSKLPWAALEVREVSWRAFHDVRRLLARGARPKHRTSRQRGRLVGAYPWQGVTIFSNSPGSYLRLGVLT